MVPEEKTKVANVGKSASGRVGESFGVICALAAVAF